MPVSCFLLGCMGLTGSRNPNPPPEVIRDRTPEPADLIGYLNRNAAQINALDSDDLDLDIQAQGKSFGLGGSLYCQKPKNFRLRAKLPALGKQVADFGSNDQEFWYFISEDRPPTLYHCAHAELERGTVPLPFPLKPEWVLEALGMSAPAPVGTPEQEQARGRTLTVRKRDNGRYLDLIESTTAPPGQRVTKVTVFNNIKNATATMPHVADHLLYDAKDQVLCRATVLAAQHDPATQALVPRKVRLEWPTQQLTLTLTLGDVAVNNPKTDRQFNEKLFTRPRAPDGAQTLDLARGMPGIGRPLSIQRAGGYRE